MLTIFRKLLYRSGTRELKDIEFAQIFEQFQNMLLEDHHRAMELMADLGEKAGGDFVFDRKYLQDFVRELQTVLLRMVKALNLIGSNRYLKLYSTLDRVLPVDSEFKCRLKSWDGPYVVRLDDAPMDNPELTGGKANTLVEIIRRLHLPVPGGFVITSRAYCRFLEHNRLENRIHTLLEAWSSGEDDLDKTSSEIRDGILSGEIPQDLAKAITRLAGKGKHNWSVRSSAYGEDGELSFAGLHETFLNVPPDQVVEKYKMVLASLFSPEAINYRRQMGIIGEEVAMSVLCQEMVDSQASGVLQTACPGGLQASCMAVYASFGLGRTTAEGRDALDQWVVAKEPPYEIKEERIASKELLTRAGMNGGEEEIGLSAVQQSKEAISEEAVRSLAEWGVRLERYFKRPLEIEWALDHKGSLKLFQTRRLRWPAPAKEPPQEFFESSSKHRILIRDKGVAAHGGVGSGSARIVQSNKDMAEFPRGAVLVTRYTAPWLARIAPRAAAIISERGSVAGHLATIAREFHVPTLVGVENATEVITDGMEITLDTSHRIIYQGRVEELIQYELDQPTGFEEAPEYRLLRRILQRVAPLHLIDPQSSNFTPEGCESVHDMIRFIHEKAVQELMDLPTVLKRFKTAKVRTLVSDVPMGLKILDLGGGLDPSAEGNEVTADQIRSLPLKALWEGLSSPGTWSTDPVALDFRGLMSSFTKTWDAQAVSLGGFNLAVIHKTYMNLHLRLGYHFNLIDARMEEDDNQNHIYFRFIGGVTDFTRRSRRAQLLGEILTHYHFTVSVKGDLIVGTIRHLPKQEIWRCLHALGFLIGFTRQLDVQLKTDADITKSVAAFFDKQGEIADDGLITTVQGERDRAARQNGNTTAPPGDSRA